MKNVFSYFLLFAFGLSFAQIQHNVGDFTTVEVFDRLAVELIQSDKNYIEVSGPNEQDVQFVNKNNRLKIRMPLEKFLKGEETKVYVYYKNIDQLFASEGSHITSDEIIKSSSLLTNAKEGAVIDLEYEGNSVDVRTNSGGVVALRGTADLQLVICNAGGAYEGKNLKTRITNVTVNAGGEADVYATELANAKTRAGGNIHIFGGAKVNQKTLAGGNVYIK